MTTKYIVAVRDHNGDLFTFYGPWQGHFRAAEFAGAVNDRIEKWQAEHPDEHGPAESGAWAYVQTLSNDKTIGRAMERAFGEAL